MTPRRLLAAELSWTGELQPPDNKPPGCAVMKNLGAAADMADSSRRKTARLEKAARSTDSPARRRFETKQMVSSFIFVLFCFAFFSLFLLYKF